MKPSGWRRWIRPRSSLDEEIAEELRFHIEGRIERHIAAGVPPDIAEDRARREFGDPDRIRRQCVDAARPAQARHWPAGVWRDLRFAVRSLRRAPAFTLAAIGLLAIGIGLTGIVLSLFYGYLIRPLPYPDADRLMRVDRSAPGTEGVPGAAPVPQGLNRIAWPSQDRFIEAMVAWEFDDFALLGAELPERVNGIWVTPGYFSALGIDPVIGRAFVTADVEDGGTVAVVGHTLWQRRFGGDPGVLGRVITAHATDRPDEATQFTVIGVLPPAFWSLTGEPDLLVPLQGTRRPSLVLVKPGVSPDGLAMHLTHHAQGHLTADPDWRMHVEPAHDAHVRPVRPALSLLLLTALIVLAIVIGNVAVLVLVRALKRERELAVRLALGARSGHVVAGWATEIALVVVSSGLIGLGLAAVGLHALRAGVEREFQTAVPGGVESLSLNLPVLAALGGLALITAGLLSLVPIVTGVARRASMALVAGSRSHESPPRSRLRSGVVMFEVGLSLVLAMGAGLMVRSAVELGRAPLGFDPDPVLRAYVSLRPEAYPDSTTQRDFYERLLDTVRGISGVERVALVDAYPFQVQRGSYLEVADRAPGEIAEVRAVRQVVTPEYFTSMAIAVLQGDAFRLPGDSPRVVISARLADQLWPNDHAVGKRMRLGSWQGPPSSDEPWHVVSGVVDDVAKTLTSENWADVYQAFEGRVRPDMYLVLRSHRDHAILERELRAAVASLDPSLPLSDVESMGAVVDRELARPRFLAVAVSGYAALALALALAGLFAVVSYTVGQRRQEIAIRMALGATAPAVVSWLFAKGVVLLLGGLAIGALAGVALRRIVSAHLHGISSFDPITLAILFPAILLLTGLAVWLPARVAARVEPMSVLRSE